MPLESKFQARSLKEHRGVTEINRSDIGTCFTEIAEIIHTKHPYIRIELPDSFEDKERFGDIDIIVLTERTPGENNDEVIDSLKDRIVTSHRIPNDTKDHFVVELKSGKQIAVDFIRATDKDDFETKRVYFSKYPLSALLGTMARQLGFTYGQDGFFYFYVDSKGQKHSFPITKDLREGMKIMGIDSADFDNLKSENHLIEFLKRSPYYSPEQFSISGMSSKRQRYLSRRDPFDVEHLSDRQLLKIKGERILYTRLSEPRPNRPSSIEAAEKCQENFQANYSAEFQQIRARITEIEAKIAQKPTRSCNL